MNKIKSTKGITLISLVVTIIILLILAGVTIATLMGDNGLINKAKDAKIKTEIAGIKEEIQTDILIEQAGNNGNISDDILKGILEKYGTINYDTDGKTIKSITTTKGNYEIAMADILSGTTNNTNNTIVADGRWNGTVNTPKIDGTGLTAVWSVMLANPIVLVVAGIALLAVGLYEAYKHCATFRNAVNTTWKDIKLVFTSFGTFFKTVFTIAKQVTEYKILRKVQ